MEDGRGSAMGGIGSIWGLVGFTVEEVETEQLPYKSDQHNYYFFFAFKAKMMRYSHVALASQYRLNLNLGLNMNTSVDT